jgi:tRNA threonylcarbamoyladenosine biosynthesis protein TsaB
MAESPSHPTPAADDSARPPDPACLPDSRDTSPALAIETSGRIGSVALGRGPRVLEARAFSTTLRHAVELLPTVDALCREHAVRPDDVAAVHVSGGPGSFTGLRIGITFARTLALATGARIVRVPTLDVIAQNALAVDPRPPFVVVVLDAKRRRIFSAPFALRQDAYVCMQEPAEVDPESFFAALPPGCHAVGEGIAYHQAAVDSAGLPVLPEALTRARAEVVYHLGRSRAVAGGFDDARGVVPIYIRRPEAEEVWERRQGAG